MLSVPVTRHLCFTIGMVGLALDDTLGAALIGEYIAVVPGPCSFWPNTRHGVVFLQVLLWHHGRDSAIHVYRKLTYSCIAQPIWCDDTADVYILQSKSWRLECHETIGQ